jgi:hypothetical protein
MTEQMHKRLTKHCTQAKPFESKTQVAKQIGVVLGKILSVTQNKQLVTALKLADPIAIKLALLSMWEMPTELQALISRICVTDPANIYNHENDWVDEKGSDEMILRTDEENACSAPFFIACHHLLKSMYMWRIQLVSQEDFLDYMILPYAYLMQVFTNKADKVDHSFSERWGSGLHEVDFFHNGSKLNLETNSTLESLQLKDGDQVQVIKKGNTDRTEELPPSSSMLGNFSVSTPTHVLASSTPTHSLGESTPAIKSAHHTLPGSFLSTMASVTKGATDTPNPIQPKNLNAASFFGTGGGSPEVAAESNHSPAAIASKNNNSFAVTPSPFDEAKAAKGTEAPRAGVNTPERTFEELMEALEDKRSKKRAGEPRLKKKGRKTKPEDKRQKHSHLMSATGRPPTNSMSSMTSSKATGSGGSGHERALPSPQRRTGLQLGISKRVVKASGILSPDNPEQSCDAGLTEL